VWPDGVSETMLAKANVTLALSLLLGPKMLKLVFVGRSVQTG